MNKFNAVIKMSNYYYQLALLKSAEQFLGDEVSEFSQYGKGEVDEGAEVIVSDPNRETKYHRKEKGNPLPASKIFQNYYQNTTIDYKLIYLGHYFGLDKISENENIIIPKAVELDTFKSMVQKKVDILNQEKDLSENNKKILMEGKAILTNFDRIFNKNAINIICNQFDNDSATPAAIDHDLGHRILDDFFPKFRISNNKGIVNAFKQDYQITKIITKKYDDGKIETKEFPIDLNREDIYAIINFAEKTLELILTKDKVNNSISMENIAQGNFYDLIQDIMAIYNTNKESFKGIQFEPVTFYLYDTYSNKGFLEPDFKSNIKEVESYKIHPKNTDIPNFKKIIDSLLEESEIMIKNSLSALVGKVFTLWLD